MKNVFTKMVSEKKTRSSKRAKSEMEERQFARSTSTGATLPQGSSSTSSTLMMDDEADEIDVIDEVGILEVAELHLDDVIE